MRTSPAALSQETDLTGRIALVTRGSPGLGRAIATAYVAVGADVVVASGEAGSVVAYGSQVTTRDRGQVEAPIDGAVDRRLGPLPTDVEADQLPRAGGV